MNGRMRYLASTTPAASSTIEAMALSSSVIPWPAVSFSTVMAYMPRNSVSPGSRNVIAGMASTAWGMRARAASRAATQPLTTAATPVASRAPGSTRPIPW